MSESTDSSVLMETSYTNESQIELGLNLGKVLSDARNARRKEKTLSRADPRDRPQIQANQQALDNLVASYLNRTGFELSQFEAIGEQLRAELRLFLEEQKVEAVKNSAHVTETLRRSVNSIFEAFHQLVERPRDILDKPILVWQTQGIDFPKTQIEPGRSLAKFTFSAVDDAGDEELSFYFLWQNPSDQLAAINVDSALVLNGVCHAFSNGGFFFPFKFTRSDLVLGANLFLYEPPFTDPLEPKATDKKILESLFAHSTGFPVAAGGIDSTVVHTIAQLHQGPFPVAPHGFTLVEVTVSIGFLAANGQVSVDFDKGDFQVMCPGVAISILV